MSSGKSKDNQDTQRDQVRGHDYDGIQEYDNSLPKWWVWLFKFTIIFAVAYVIYYHFGSGASLQATLAGDLQSAAANQAVNPSSAATVDWKDPKMIAMGKVDFLTTCMPCHGEAGQGNIGPNLTDKFWIHGGSPEAILKTVSDGVVDKGMPAWKPVLGEEKVKAITAFVLSIKGTNAPGGKAAQGEEEK